MLFNSVLHFLTDKVGSVSGDSGHGSSHTDAYDELFHTPNMMDLDPLDNDQEKTGNKVSSFGIPLYRLQKALIQTGTLSLPFSACKWYDC